MSANEFTNNDRNLNHGSAYHALLAIDGLLEEAEYLRRKLNEMC